MRNMLEEIGVCCPYCGASFVTLADCSAGSQTYVEDCQVCCAPINVQLRVDAGFDLEGFTARRDDE